MTKRFGEIVKKCLISQKNFKAITFVRNNVNFSDHAVADTFNTVTKFHSNIALECIKYVYEFKDQSICTKHEIYLKVNIN